MRWRGDGIGVGDGDGKVKGVRKGAATIAVTPCNGKAAKVKITVK